MKKISLILSVLTAFALMTFLFSACNKDEEPEEPEVSFDISKNYYKAPVEVSFTNTSEANDYTISSWEWDFGDDETSTEKSATHEYTEAGYHHVTLKANYGDGEEKYGNGYVTVYGDITGWTPDDVDLYKDAWADEDLPVSAYLVLRDAQGNIYHYSDSETFKTWSELDADHPPIGISINGYGEQALSSGQITFELLEYDGGETVNPDSDREIYSVTINGSDFMPENEEGPYMPIYNPSEPVSMGIDWLVD